MAEPGRAPVPVFETPEEEDEFWQTHSPLDFEHTVVPFCGPRELRPAGSPSLTIRLDPDDRSRVDQVARRLGEPPTSVVRRYIRTGLDRDLSRLGTDAR